MPEGSHNTSVVNLLLLILLHFDVLMVQVLLLDNQWHSTLHRLELRQRNVDVL